MSRITRELIRGGLHHKVQFPTLAAVVAAGARDGRILCIGDSTTAGVGGGAAYLDTGEPASYPYKLAATLQGLGLPSAAGLGIYETQNSTVDARWTLGAGWAVSNYFGFATKACVEWQTTVGNLVYADPNVLADRFDIYYLTNTGVGLGSFGATATGGSTSNVNTNAAVSISKVTVSAASASTANTVTIVPANNGPVLLVGIEPWLSTTRKVRVANGGVSGSITADWINPSTIPGLGSLETIKAYAPDLTIVSLGINDAGAGVAAATFTSNLDQIITAAQVSGDVLVMAPIPSTSAAGGTYVTYEGLYYAALPTGIGTATYANLTARTNWATGDQANAAGFMYNALHPNAAGYADIATYLAGLIYA